MRGGNDRAARIRHIAALAVGIGAGAIAAADDGSLTEPPVAGVEVPLTVPGAEEALKLFAPRAPQPVNPLEGVDVPRPLAPAPQRAPAVQFDVIVPAGQPVPVIVPQVEGREAFQVRFLIINGQKFGGRVRLVMTSVPRGRDAWITSILRTTDRERAREEAEQRLEEWLDVLTRAFALTEAQRSKLRLAGQGDISRFLDECEALVGEALALEAAMETGESSSTQPLWERCADLRKRYVSGLHEGDSLLRKQWEAAWEEQGSGPAPKSVSPPELPPQKSAYPIVRIPQE